MLHLDDDLVVASKPPGMAVHRGEMSGPGEEFVLQRLGAQIGRYLYPVQRLDRATSGVIAFGLTRPAAAALQASLSASEARKEYLVLARGAVDDELSCERPLSNESGAPQPARTTFRCIARFSRCSLLRARIHTGRHHQIRRHLDHLAHQVIGDTTHGKGRINKWFREHYGLPRMFLHAETLAIAHPASGAPLTVRDPLPEDLRGFLGRLPDVPEGLLDELSG